MPSSSAEKASATSASTKEQKAVAVSSRVSYSGFRFKHRLRTQDKLKSYKQAGNTSGIVNIGA